jgi:hypothetical protein
MFVDNKWVAEAVSLRRRDDIMDKRKKDQITNNNIYKTLRINNRSIDTNSN